MQRAEVQLFNVELNLVHTIDSVVESLREMLWAGEIRNTCRATVMQNTNSNPSESRIHKL